MSKVLCVKNGQVNPAELPFDNNQTEFTFVASCEQAMELLQTQKFDGLFYCNEEGSEHLLSQLLRQSRIFDLVPHGVAVLDPANVILQANDRLTQWCENTDLVGLNFFDALGNPDIISDPIEMTPLTSARTNQGSSRATLACNDRYFELIAIPMGNSDSNLLVSLADSTESYHLRSKMKSLHEAGVELADLSPEEIHEMGYDERIDILKDNILHYTQDLLNFDVVEIRLIDPHTKELRPLLSVGIDSGVEQRLLMAEDSGNGVTGFVAATGQSYLCEDTTNDPLYMDGLLGAKSSLTVPLIYQDQILGSFNVESPERNAFCKNDLLFVESFVRDISHALNTLNLLNAQQADATLTSIAEIQSAVGLPIDEILNDAVQVIESSANASPEVLAKMASIISRARKIKRVIQEVGREMTSENSVFSSIQERKCPALNGKRILVIDADEKVRTSAHAMLERYGCDVETAKEGHQAIVMIQSCHQGGLCSEDGSYDAIIADIRLPDIAGFDLLMALKGFITDPPLILMTGFGYDPGHSIVNARKAGLKTSALLYKPFRHDDLLNALESIVSPAVPPAN